MHHAATPLLKQGGATGANRWQKTVTKMPKKTAVGNMVFKDPSVGVDRFVKEGKKREKRHLQRQKTSYFGQMLSPNSPSAQSVVYRTVMSALILVNVVAFIASTYPSLNADYGSVFDNIEAVSSCAFLVDYITRLVTIGESKKWAAKGCVGSRVAWALSGDGLLDAMATFPYFLDTFVLNSILPSMTWVRIFRIFVIIRTSKSAHAINTVSRVIFVNREILTTASFMVLFMLLLTSAMLWGCANDDIRQINDIDSVPSAMYLALQMLTGQGLPDGDLDFTMKAVCMFTAFLSVPFFAVPAAMLTWGFEAEAERLAEREQRRFQRKKIYDADLADRMSESEDSSDSDMEEYLQRWGTDDAKEEVEEDALAFFEKEKHAVWSGAQLREKASTKSMKLHERQDWAEKRATLRHDALLMLEQVREYDKSEFTDDAGDASALEGRLSRFRELVRETVDDPRGVVEEPANDKGGTSAAEPSLSEVLAEMKALRGEVALLAKDSELKALRVEVAMLARDSKAQYEALMRRN